jgi:hypothetical protein
MAFVYSDDTQEIGDPGDLMKIDVGLSRQESEFPVSLRKNTCRALKLYNRIESGW